MQLSDLWTKISEKISDTRQFLLTSIEWIPSKGESKWIHKNRNSKGSLFDLKSVVNSPNFSDLKLHSEGKVIFAHKAILSIRSPKWLHHLTENSSIQALEYVHVDIPVDMLLLILEFIYTTEIPGNFHRIFSHMSRSRRPST